MSEHSDAIAELDQNLVLAGITWAGKSAVRRVMNDYSAATGYNQAWVGFSVFTLFGDRLDRVFACGAYELPQDAELDAGLDVLHDGLDDEDIRSIPRIAHGLVRYAPLNGSPGWSFGEWRWLLASARYGRTDEILWGSKSQTKQRVAKQPNPDEPTLFEELEIPGLGPTAPVIDWKLMNLKTLVVVHGVDLTSFAYELHLGRPRSNPGGGKAWHWKENLLSSQSVSSERERRDRSIGFDDGQLEVPDAPVRFRARSDEAQPQELSGDR